VIGASNAVAIDPASAKAGAAMGAAIDEGMGLGVFASEQHVSLTKQFQGNRLISKLLAVLHCVPEVLKPLKHSL
jgi:hypothetical protein